PKLRAVGLDESFAVYAGFGGDDRLFTLEIWRPDDVDVVDVAPDGLVFATPAQEFIDRLAEAGNRLDIEDVFHPLLPELSIGLDREGGEEVDEDGLAIYFQSIFVAQADYYVRPA
ncbi:MAG TPA: hypothetical protein VFO77_01480, partial [Actinoplanes sp.]|nr:hypothetical protein [Actinoplanes sp.]